MKIVINCRILNKRHGGPRRFLINILINLAKIDKTNNYVLLVDKKLSFIYDWPKNFRIINLNISSRFLYEYVKLPQYVNSIGVDVFIVPDPVFSPFIKARKKIAVYHDIIYFEKSRKREFNFFDNLHHKVMIPFSGKRTDIIICVSKFTEARVHSLLGFKNTKVIYEGVEESFKQESIEEQNLVLKKYNIKKPFIFYIGSMSPRKNIERAINSFYAIRNNIKHNFYLVGGYSWKDSNLINKINSPQFKKRIKKIGHIEEEDLPSVYSAADALIYPSLYEGFGLPILEAQACGCPVVTSKNGATSEVAGNGAALVNPLSEKEISMMINRVIIDRDFKDSIISRGTLNLKRFSWLDSATELLKTFK